MGKVTEYKGLVAVHPGFYLEKLLDYYSMSQDEVALRIGTTAKTVSLLVNGLGPVSAEMAENLGQVFSMESALWLKYESDYNRTIVRINRLKQLDEQKKIAAWIDSQFFIDNKIVKSFSEDEDEKVLLLQNIFMVGDLTSILRMDPYTINTRRRDDVTDEEAVCSAVWYQIALKLAREMKCESYDAEKLRSALTEIKKLMGCKKDEMIPALRKILSEAGVAFVLLPPLKNSLMKGCVKWLHGSRKCILALADDFEYEDEFWLTLYRGLSYVLQRRLTRLIVRDDGRLLVSDPQVKEIEDGARHFADKQLMGVRDYTLFCVRKSFSVDVIKEFASRCGILPSIIAARLIREKKAQPTVAIMALRKKNRPVKGYLWDELDRRNEDPLKG